MAVAVHVKEVAARRALLQWPSLAIVHLGCAAGPTNLPGPLSDLPPATESTVSHCAHTPVVWLCARLEG